MFSFSFFFCALAFFIYGLLLTTEGLKKFFGSSLEPQIHRFTKNRITGFFFGFFSTLAFQSSIAVNILFVGLAKIGAVRLYQTIPVVLGSDVGTTVVVFLLASFLRLDLQGFSQVFVFCGVAGFLFFRNHDLRPMSKSILGVSLVFYGLSLMGVANQPLKESHLFLEIVEQALSRPWVALFAGLFASVSIQSSAAVLGILLSFVAHGIVTLDHAIPMVLGANIGSAISPFLLGFQSESDAKRIVYVHLGSKLVGALVGMFLISSLADLSRWVFSDSGYQLAFVHFLFNVGLALVFLPTTGKLSERISRWIPISESEDGPSIRYLDPKALTNPTWAFACVSREISVMADVVEKMCAELLEPFRKKDRHIVEQMDDLDDQVDFYERAIKLYLAKISESELSESQSKRQLELLSIATNLESIGDVINGTIMEIAEKKRLSPYDFSREAWKQIEEFHATMFDNFRMAVNAFVTVDRDISKRVIRKKKFIASFEKDLRFQHLKRLQEGDKQSIETSSMFLDLLSQIRLINSIVTKMTYPVIDRRATDPH
ncbi:MAG: Na/Pi cotransporter family protein [Bdellovibrionota bacterium]